MRYSKTHVNEILALVAGAINDANPHDEFLMPSYEIEIIKEEHLLIDRRISSLPEYTTEVLKDFMSNKYSYKELMKKYHCSMRTVKSLLLSCAENDERVYHEIEIRRH